MRNGSRTGGAGAGRALQQSLLWIMRVKWIKCRKALENLFPKQESDLDLTLRQKRQIATENTDGWVIILFT
jgi:hypothetical protein